VNHAKYVLALILLAPAMDARAFDYDLSTRAAVWSSSMNLDNASDLTSTQVWVRANQSYSEDSGSVGFYGEGWLNQETGQTADHFAYRIRQGYVQVATGPFDFRAGLQMFPWGRADGINPTDNLTPRQLTFLTRDFDDQRFGTPALSASWFSDPISLTAIWLAGFRQSVLPWPTPFFQTRDIRPASPSDQWAAKLESVQGSFEGSLSYYDGYDVLPTAAFLNEEPVSQLLLAHGRVRVLGGDFALPVGRVVIRGELARSLTDDPQSEAVFSARPQSYAVMGGEHTFGDYFDVDVQYYFRHVDGNPVPAGLTGEDQQLGQELAVTAQQYDRIDRGYTFRIADQWLNETLEASVSGVFSTVRRGYLVRPMVKYKATDELTIGLGADVLHGDADSIYGALSKNSTTYLEFRWGY
jgi:hypothetical protein